MHHDASQGTAPSSPVQEKHATVPVPPPAAAGADGTQESFGQNWYSPTFNHVHRRV